MNVALSLPSYAADRLDPEVFAILESALTDGRYDAHGEDFRDLMIKCAALTVIEGPAYVESLFATMPVRLDAWNAEKEKLSPLLERAEARHRVIEADKKVKAPPPEKVEKEKDQWGNQAFLKEFHDTLQNGSRDVQTRMREAAFYNSDPVAETAAVMQVESPYDRVIEAANKIRAGRRVNTRDLHFFVK